MQICAMRTCAKHISLIDANLAGADLRGAMLLDAQLNWAMLEGAIISPEQLRQAKLESDTL